MSETPKKIHAAMLAVLAEVGAIGKNRTNSTQNYKFRGIDDVLAHLQPLMAKHGVLCTPRVLEREREVLQTRNGGSMVSVRLLVEHTFRAADDSTVVATTLGEAMDSGDKASNKAMSAALKYALTESFAIPTYETNVDTEEQSPEIATPQAKQTALTAALQKSIDTVNRAAAAQRPATPSQPAPRVSAGPASLPNYGKAKGQPIHGASMRDLEFYAAGCRKSLADPAKANWHAKEQALLEAIQDEMARQSGPPSEEPPPPTDADAPPEAF